MRKCNIIVDKIIYRDKESAYTVLSGTVLRWSQHKKEFLPTKEKHTFVGYFLCLFNGDKFEVEVEEIFNPTYGSQYNVTSSKRIEPSTLTEVRNFFAKNIKALTPTKIEKLLQAYGMDSINVICQSPEALNFLGLSPDTTADIRTAIIEGSIFESIMTYLMQYDIDCRMAMPLYQKYKENTIQILDTNPYTPYLHNIYDFRTADKIYLYSGAPEDSEKRCRFATLAALRNDTEKNGNVFTRRENLWDKVKELLQNVTINSKPTHCPFVEDDISGALNQLENMGTIIIDSKFCKEAIYLKDNYYAERKIGQFINGFMNEIKHNTYHPDRIESFLTKYEQEHGISLAEAQRQAVHMALSSPISIISGGPGTGKTMTIQTIIAAIKEMTPDANIRACAPTGKAAIRIEEMTKLKASTIHRAIGLGSYAGTMRDGELVCDFMFVDEFSMTDLHLFEKLLDAINPCARIVIVGDYNQLPSVGAGLVLRDLIQSGTIPTIILNQIFRQAQSSLIVMNAHSIINQVAGQPINLRIAQKPDKDFYFIEENNPQFILKIINKTVERLQSYYHLGLDDIQLLSPVNYGDLGVENLNYIFQKELNSSNITVNFAEKEFKMGDKVVHTKNNRELDVYNGEVGVITDITYKKEAMLKVSYLDKDVIYPFVNLDELELAYALTVHKSQGSEYPAIILPVHETQGQGLSKNLIYTALTRAKKMVIIIGSASALSSGMRRETILGRESNLIGRLKSILPPAKHFGGGQHIS